MRPKSRSAFPCQCDQANNVLQPSTPRQKIPHLTLPFDSATSVRLMWKVSNRMRFNSHCCWLFWNGWLAGWLRHMPYTMQCIVPSYTLRARFSLFISIHPSTIVLCYIIYNTYCIYVRINTEHNQAESVWIDMVCNECAAGDRRPAATTARSA